MSDNAPCIIARAPCCGRLVYASANEPKFWDEQSKKELAELAIDGYKIEHVTAEEVRAAKWGCKCSAAQGSPSQEKT